MAEPAQIVDLALVEDTNDLAFSARDISTISGSDMVKQSLKVALQLFKGEWFLDANAGVPYYQEILEKGVDTSVVDAILRRQILATAGVNRLLKYSSTFDAATRIVSVAFTADSVYGPVEFEGALI